MPTWKELAAKRVPFPFAASLSYWLIDELSVSLREDSSSPRVMRRLPQERFSGPGDAAGNRLPDGVRLEDFRWR